jgi:Flp pilus assembly pilin Flp
MTRILRPIVPFLKREEGITAVECALMLALVVVICIVAINMASSSRELTADPAVVQTASR